MLVTFDNIKTFYNVLVQKIKGSRGNWNQNDPNADDYIKNRPFYSEVKEENLILVNNLTSDSSNWPKCNFVPGQFYNITWNGILYSDVLCHTDGEYNMLGGVDNYPFYIDDDGGDGLYIDSQDDAWTVSISCSVIQEVVHKLDKKFVDMPDMPEGIVTSDELAQVAFDGNYNSLINTPTIYTDVVRYSPIQYLTTAQKNTVRTKIDVYSKDEVIANYVQMENNTIALPLSSDWQSVTYGDGKFVAITYNNDRAAYSTDGITWTQTILPLLSNWQSVTYGNGKFVAITYNNDCAAYSTDGITWTQTNLPLLSNWESVTYGNGKFVAVCNASSVAAYSTDGITWTQTNLPLSSNWQSVTYGNGKFVAVCYGDNRAAYSEDGITWTQTNLPFGGNWYSVTYGNGKFVAVYKASSVAAYSTDGITWTQTNLPLSLNWQSVTYGDGKFVAVCYGDNRAAYSEDGITWTRTYKTLMQNGVRITPAQLGFKEPDLTGYATTEQLDNAVASLVNSAPEALNTLNELATALGDDPNFATTIATELGKKANTEDLGALATKNSLTASEVGALSKDTPLFSGDYNDLENAPDISEDNSGDLIIADKDGNIIFRSNDRGLETTTLIAQNIELNGTDIEDEIQAQTMEYVDANSVKFTEQTLTEEQKEKARENIGAETSVPLILNLADYGIDFSTPLLSGSSEVIYEDVGTFWEDVNTVKPGQALLLTSDFQDVTVIPSPATLYYHNNGLGVFCITSVLTFYFNGELLTVSSNIMHEQFGTKLSLTRIDTDATQTINLSDYGINMLSAMISAMNGQTFTAIDCSAFISAASRILEQNKVPLFYEPTMGVHGFVSAIGLDYQLIASMVGNYGDAFLKADVVFLNEGIHLFLSILGQELPAELDAVLYTEQTLTDEQKAQARENIGITGTGADGYTPVRGTDYWTDADKAEIKSYVDEAILGGVW